MAGFQLKFLDSGEYGNVCDKETLSCVKTTDIQK